MRLFAALLLLALGGAAAARGGSDNYATERNAITLSPAQTRFVLRCGGCHGTLGVSPPRSVPMLRGVAGWFLCTPEGRDYVIRLPNVARAQLGDAELADVMNFVAFDLGEASAPAGAPRFTASEVQAIRARPLNTAPLLSYRRTVVRALMARCKAPRALLTYGAVPDGGPRSDLVLRQQHGKRARQAEGRVGDRAEMTRRADRIGALATLC